MKLTVYTTHCPKCKVVEMKLKQKDIKFEIVDEISAITEYGKKNGINSAPILDVDGKAYNFVDAVKYINSL